MGVGRAHGADPATEASSAQLFFCQTFYHAAILPLLVLTVLLAWLARPSTAEAFPAGFRSFQLRYLSGWCLCVAADWLQGPYVYALYSAYGFTKHEIAQLFVAGFGASLVCGCFVGSLADRFGRKRSALAYCALYIVSCATKHWKVYRVLMFGRITGGVATSLLFSCFECWMVSEHLGRHGFSSGLLSYMFGLMYTLMYLVAIVSGVLAQWVADGFVFRPVSSGSLFYVGGTIAPFDLASGCLMVGGVLIAGTWGENYGSESAGASSSPSTGAGRVLREAWALLAQDRRLWLLGVVVACFEGAMFAFVFNWTPALESQVVPPPLGLIFSLFMMACTCGASLGTVTAGLVRPALRLGLVCSVGVAAFFVLAFAVGGDHLRLCFFAFLVFECMVGVYFPTVGVLKSEVVPEHVRGTMYNIYRVPLNGVVVALLLTNLSLLRCYGLCASLLLLALVAIAAIEAGRPARNAADEGKSKV